MGLRKLLKCTVPAAAAAMIAGCQTAPAPKVAQTPLPAAPKNQLPYKWTQGSAPRAHEDAVALFGPLHLKPGEYLWATSMPKEKDTRVVVDLLSQLFYVYQGDALVGVTTISSGKKGRETPLGFWSVIRKQKLGHSRKYDNAPMPFMQMYDEKGIAFHAGPNPGRPASHGCIRLPLKFAAKLYDMTTVGTKLVIEG
ncbi:lipoprotein-anchoring transpeptidase ErfK/SrfK [Sphingomonas sp. F9_3S_D5_B_2]